MMVRLTQVDLEVDKRMEVLALSGSGIKYYYVILMGPGITITLPHTASYFRSNKKYTITIVEQGL